MIRGFLHWLQDQFTGRDIRLVMKTDLRCVQKNVAGVVTEEYFVNGKLVSKDEFWSHIPKDMRRLFAVVA